MGSERQFKHGDWVVCVCYSHDGNLLCTVSRNSSVMIHDLSNCHTRERRPSKRKTLAGAMVGSRQGSKQRHDSQDRHSSKRHHMREEEDPPKKMPHDDNTWFANFSADSELLVTASGWERGHAIVFDVASMDELLRIPHRDWTMSAKFSPFGN